jgi:predicted O-methyltransferase YrrM
MTFHNKLPNDYYQMNVIKEFHNKNTSMITNYDAPIYQRNPPTKYKLTLNHIELIEYFVRMIKPKNFMELGVQFGEATRRIIPHIVGDYYAVDMERSDNIDYFEHNYSNFHFIRNTTDEFFDGVDKNLQLEMVFIDACHSHEATYRDFLNVKEHLVNDGIIFMHDMYPKDKESTDAGLSGDCYKTAEKIRLEHNNEFEIITIPVEPGISMLRKVNRQVDWLSSKSIDRFGFMIAACLRTNEHLIQLHRCLSSIQTYNPKQQRVVVMDHTSSSELVALAIESNPDVRFELGTEPIPADMLLLQYFKKNKYFEKAVLLQDSMLLKNTIFDEEIDHVKDIQYVWHFTNHRKHWHTIREPESDYNERNGIVTHDDLINHIIDTKIDKEYFKQYCKGLYPHKDMWCGCFGTCCIISHDFLIRLDKETDIIHLQQQMITNRLRRAIESIFALACQYMTKRSMEDSYDGLYYDGEYSNNFEGRSVITKVSFDRQ